MPLLLQVSGQRAWMTIQESTRGSRKRAWERHFLRRSCVLALSGLLAMSALPASHSLPTRDEAGNRPRSLAGRPALLMQDYHRFCGWVRLRGGDEGEGDTFGQHVEGGQVESALTDPEMTKVRAFMPKELQTESTQEHPAGVCD